MHQTITIASRFKGPPNSGNGGYCCGIMAKHIEGAAEASLHAPPPLDHEVTVTSSEDGIEMRDGDTLLGLAKPTFLDLEVPALPDPLILGGDPVDAPGRPAVFRPFGTCFVCGHDREHPDGLCLFSKLVEGHDGMVASRWTLDASFADADGFVAPEFIWSALDCPGYFACAPGEAALLGRLKGQILKPMTAEGEATVIGWDLGHQGRKRNCGTAVFDAEGTLVAKAEGLWIIVKPELIAKGAA